MASFIIKEPGERNLSLKRSAMFYLKQRGTITSKSSLLNATDLSTKSLLIIRITEWKSRTGQDSCDLIRCRALTRPLALSRSLRSWFEMRTIRFTEQKSLAQCKAFLFDGNVVADL